MFITILTGIYLALALFILGQFIKNKKFDPNIWDGLKYRFSSIFIKDSEIDEAEPDSKQLEHRNF